MPGYFPWPKDKSTPHVLRRAATMILAFDALIDNDDRSTGSENLLSRSTEFVLIDHELAFSFLTYNDGLEACLRRSVGRLPSHPLVKSFRRKRLDLADFSARLRALTGEAIRELCDSLPSAMRGDELSQICEWLKALRDRDEKFLEAIQEVMYESASQRL
jgi:hypothetical protein